MYYVAVGLSVYYFKLVRLSLMK